MTGDHYGHIEVIDNEFGEMYFYAQCCGCFFTGPYRDVVVEAESDLAKHIENPAMRRISMEPAEFMQQVQDIFTQALNKAKKTNETWADLTEIAKVDAAYRRLDAALRQEGN